MRKLASLAAILAGVLVATVGWRMYAGHWTSVDSPCFSAELQGQPKHEVTSSELSGLAVQVDSYSVEGRDFSSSIICDTVPTNLTNSSFLGGAQGTAGSLGLTIAESRPTTLDRLPGLSFRMTGTREGAEVTGFGQTAAFGNKLVIILDLVKGRQDRPSGRFKSVVESFRFKR